MKSVVIENPAICEVHPVEDLGLQHYCQHQELCSVNGETIIIEGFVRY